MNIVKKIEFTQKEKEALYRRGTDLTYLAIGMCSDIECDGCKDCSECPLSPITNRIMDLANKLKNLGISD